MFAILVKLGGDPKKQTLRGGIVTSVTAILAASVFTDPVLQVMGWQERGLMPAIAALVALTGEHLARQIMALNIKEILELWRGKK